MITFHRRKNLQYYDVSAKSNYNYEKPFLWLARKLLKNNAVHMTGEVALAPPVVQLSAQDQAALDREYELMMNTELPPEDDEDM